MVVDEKFFSHNDSKTSSVAQGYRSSQFLIVDLTVQDKAIVQFTNSRLLEVARKKRVPLTSGRVSRCGTWSRQAQSLYRGTTKAMMPRQ